jgi:hypothetical protein
MGKDAYMQKVLKHLSLGSQSRNNRKLFDRAVTYIVLLFFTNC